MAFEYDKEVRFTCAIRGFHYYRDVWDPSSYESLKCYHERNNPFDRFTIKVVQLASDKVVGHFPMEISRATKFLLEGGADVSVTITGTHYQRSPLVQGRPEIPCNLTANLPGYSARNHLLLQKYLEIVSNLYVEPANEEIIGSLLVPNEGSGRANRTNSKQPGPPKKGRPADAEPKPQQGLDIRLLLQRAETCNREIKGQQNKDSSAIIINQKRLLLRK